MTEISYAFIGVVIGVALTVEAFWLSQRRRRNLDRLNRSKAVSILRAHGLSPRLYIGAFGIEDPELRRAVDEFVYSGHVIMNDSDQVVGVVCPAAPKGPRLRLVVSNDLPSHDTSRTR